MHLGGHVSIAGSFDKCIDRIAEIGGNCLMTFASSPRSLQFKNIDPKLIQKYLDKKDESGIGPHFFHGVYLVNLASKSKSYLKASINSLIFYQQLAGEINAVGTIFHIGSHMGEGLEKTIDQVVAAINFTLDSSPKGVRLILENAAGQGGAIGEKFEDLAQIISRVGDKSKIGVCLDTQHCFAAGYTLDTVLEKFDRIIGLKRLSVIHLNDSKTEFGSKIDRHENIGLGKIGEVSLAKFASDARLKTIPFILEVPGDGNGPRKQDIDTLKSMLS
ncbi:hypothetical protein A2634_04380 [Candidatus Amesbacteria bacterium RIFCSPHIGHO2_01_FULL_48_32]|uniref:Probable endonuclease 4 n=1 Tax=Candidatus Amesbacteria bacterium RIFCSPLOWO2_01_FULL_48_25 TaxID=1797259 RepID=A0A1F4ZDK8_9BACT|nr:MAG: hypothetical protein A2634_04380 [Candidatus Amesbacteria bacterium RIFCSPHIGHO2_01_FULL_48_32]OGD03787.1 MAG: hypothetical protein A2989_03845 [Candidatus Amesbacteria bacterium RIFCSPLOWO2_01_FULL_48_25]HJZ05106.1 deoxyribonuclease IV [Patescibacteria group bacterium]